MIAEFFENTEVFITGASGVVGKALLEKLLRSCNVKRIYILLRTKKNIKPNERLAALYKDKIFRQLRSKKEKELQKIVCIAGDVSLPYLGISSDDKRLMQNVSIVFHCAATIRFDEPLLQAIALNVGGTFEALKFAETLRHLKLFMHVSTYYSNPYLKYIEAKVYPAPMDWRVCLKMLQQNLSEDEVNFLTKRIIEGFPNTYTFTKNVAESLVNDYRGHLPVAIYRPSIVFCSFAEPEPGFPTAPIGAVGFVTAVFCGVQKVVYANPKIKMDYCSLDVCVKSMLYYTVKAGGLYEKGKPSILPVYFTSSLEHITYNFGELIEILSEEADKWPYVKSLLLSGCVCTSSRILYWFLFIIKQIVPALLVDCMLIAFGRKPVLMAVMRKIHTSSDILIPFFFNVYANEGITEYDEFMRTIQGTEFDVSDVVDTVRHRNGVAYYLANCSYKIRDVFLDEDPSSLPLARKILKIKKLIYFGMQLVLANYLVKTIFGLFSNFSLRCSEL